MSRPILPSALRSVSSNTTGPPGDRAVIESSRYVSQSKPTYSKRGKITIVACASCRRRKTKCNGSRPACAQCQSRNSPCHYDMTDEQRRLTYLRDNVEHLVEEKASLENLIYTLRTESEDKANALLRRIRDGTTDMYDLAAEVHNDKLRAQDGNEQVRPVSRLKLYEQLFRHMVTLSEPTSEEIYRRIRLGEDVDSVLQGINVDSAVSPQQQVQVAPSNTSAEKLERPSPATSSSAVSGAISENTHMQDISSPPAIVSRWTNVTNDHELIQHLVSLYFSWHHPLNPCFSESKFRRDMASGEESYCSSSLVNAICAIGCLFPSGDQELSKQDDDSTIGTNFFEESVKLLNRDHSRKMTTIATTSLLSFLEGNFNRTSSMWMYSARCAGMMIDINLHVRSIHNNIETRRGSLGSDESGRLQTFWGSFVADQMISLALGRLPIIPANSISIDLPIAHTADDFNWQPHGMDRLPVPGLYSAVFQHLISLSKLVNSTLNILYAPSHIMSGKLLMRQYSRYRKWHEDLPQKIRAMEDAPPHVLSLHMFYWNSVLLLFRPFVKARIAETDMSPGEICHNASIKISELFALHQGLYGLNGISFCQLSCLVTACTVLIMNLPAPKTITHLKNACDALHQLAPRNLYAQRGIDVIDSLVQKWNIILPGEVEQALNRDVYMAASAEQSIEASDTSTTVPKRRSVSGPSTVTPQKRPRLRPLEHYVAPEKNERSSGDAVSKYLFVPFPDQPTPILVPIHGNDDIGSKIDEEIVSGLEGLSFTGDWSYLLLLSVAQDENHGGETGGKTWEEERGSHYMWCNMISGLNVQNEDTLAVFGKLYIETRPVISGEMSIQ